MKNRLKIAAYLFGGLMVLLIGAVIALKVLFPPEKVQAMALEKLEASLGREVRLGSASVGLRGVSLSGLEISQEPDFKAGTLLKAEDLQLVVKLWPLVTKRELQVVKCSLSGWSIDYSAKPPPKKKKGKKAAPAKKASAQASAPTAAPQLKVAQLSLAGGSIRYRDKKAGTDVQLSKIALSASDVRLDGPFDASLSFAFKSGRGKAARTGKLAFKGSIDLAGGELSKLVLRAAPLTLEAEGVRVVISGTVKNADRPELDLKLKMPAIPAEKLAQLAGTPQGMGLPAVTGTLKARLAGDAVRIVKFRLESGGLSISASGRILLANKKRREPVINLSLRSNKFDLKRLVEIYPAVKKYGLAGTTDFKLQAKGKASDPALSGKVKLNQAAFASAGQKFSGVNGAVDLTPKNISGQLKGKWNSGNFDIKLSALGYKGPRPKFTFNGKLSVLDLTTLPEGKKSPPAKKPAKKGTAPPQKQKATQPVAAAGSIVIGKIMHPNFKASKTTIDWDLENVSTDLSKLDGTIKFNVGAGEFDDLRTLAKDKPIVKVILLPVMVLQKVGRRVKIPFFPNFDRVRFKEIVGDYDIKQGNLTVKKSRLDSTLALVDMTGTADLGKDKLNLAMTARIGARRGLPIKFKVLGSLSDPKVKLDAKALLKQPAVSDALKKGEQLLRGLFKR